jgi:hypothetical protein
MERWGVGVCWYCRKVTVVHMYGVLVQNWKLISLRERDVFDSPILFLDIGCVLHGDWVKMKRRAHCCNHWAADCKKQPRTAIACIDRALVYSYKACLNNSSSTLIQDSTCKMNIEVSPKSFILSQSPILL